MYTHSHKHTHTHSPTTGGAAGVVRIATSAGERGRETAVSA